MESNTQRTVLDVSTTIGLLVVLTALMPAQTKTLKVAGVLDDVNAPSAAPIPGLRHAFRQQILIGPARLQALTNKKLAGLHFRRDLGNKSALTGGVVDMTVRLSLTSRAPGEAVADFAGNAPVSSQTTVYSGPVSIPNSPALGSSVSAWSAANSFSILFSKEFDYTGSTLCIDITGVPRVDGFPDFWYVDHEYRPGGGQTRVFGTTCSNHTASGESIRADKNGLVIGGTVRTLMFGRPGASVLLLVGTTDIANGLDLTPMGAIGCRQHVSYFAIAPLPYQPKMGNTNIAYASFVAQVPASRSLLGSKVYLQSAESQLGLSRKDWTNPAGLTTSHGLELLIGLQPPSLGMSVVRSDPVARGKPTPTRGEVDVEHAPVLRISYR